jgi:hypothetical protein
MANVAVASSGQSAKARLNVSIMGNYPISFFVEAAASTEDHFKNAEQNILAEDHWSF